MSRWINALSLVAFLAIAAASSACQGISLGKASPTALGPAGVTPQPSPSATATAAAVATPSATASPSPAPTSTAAPSPTSSLVTYTVKAGDTLSDIAAVYGTTVEAIARANSLADPNVLAIGQVLIIPTPEPTATQSPTAAA